ncbi:TonB-dependent receptor [Sphingomonas oryzagri]
MLAIALAFATPAAAQQRQFDIPSQPIAKAVAAFGRQAHVQIVAPADGMDGVLSGTVRGGLDAHAALQKLIAGTGLEIVSEDGGHVVLRRKKPRETGEATGETVPDRGAENSEIVVSGYRASLQSARTIKRRSDAILDAVAAEDIGQLPDNSATEALARLPGVEIFRNRGEGQSITIRGTSSVVTTINGQEAYTGASRRTLLNSYPAGLIKSMEVYKSLTPDLIEGGIGGEVNVQLREPLDLPIGLSVAGTLRGSYDDRAKKGFYNGDLLVSGHWQTGIGEIGAMVDASYTRRDYLEAYRENYTPETTKAGTIIPSAMLVKHIQGNYKRPVVTGELQWRPAYNLGMHVRVTNVTDDNTYLDNDFQTNIAATTALSNVVLVPGTNVVKSATFLATANSGPRSDFTHQRLDTTQIEYGANWNSGIATLTTSAVYTLSTIKTDQELFLLAFNAAPTVNADFQSDSRYGGLGYSYAGNVDVTDIDQFHVRAYSDERTRQKGNGIQWRTDLALDTGDGFFRNFKTGFRFTDRKTTYQDGTNLVSLSGPVSNYPGGANPIAVDSGFGGDDVTIPTSWASYPTALLGNAGNLQALNAYIQSLPGLSANFADNGRPAYNPLSSFSGREKTYAAYAQFKYGFGVFGVPIDGVIGARLVNTDLSIQGTEHIQSKVSGVWGPAMDVPIDGHQNYLDIDPSVSAVAHFTPNLQLRLSWTKTLTRPDFGNLNPSVTFAQATTAGGTYVGTATASGNPNLRPTRSKNYDASLEYYFWRAGQASVALFDRELDGFIVNTIQQYTPQGGTGIASVTMPVNAGKGHIRGVETAVSTFFDGLPGLLHNFGASANFTYVDTRQNLPATATAAALSGPSPGISKYVYNTSLFYDDGRFRARVAYGWRSGFTLSYNTSDPAHNLKWYPISRLDASMTYRFGRNLSLTIDATNLINKPQRSYWGTKAITDRVYYEGRVYSAALRFKF